MPITIRQATMQDVPAIARLAGELGYPSSSGEVSRRLVRMFPRDDHEAFVALDEAGEVVGWIHVFVTLRLESDPFAELGGFVVAEKARGQGVGRKLLEPVEGWVRGRGIAKLRVRSRTEREAAHRFYERLGFSQTKTQKVFGKTLDLS